MKSLERPAKVFYLLWEKPLYSQKGGRFKRWCAHYPYFKSSGLSERQYLFAQINSGKRQGYKYLGQGTPDDMNVKWSGSKKRPVF